MGLLSLAKLKPRFARCGSIGVLLQTPISRGLSPCMSAEGDDGQYYDMLRKVLMLCRCPLHG
jgi:hypothetical protein